VVGAGIDVIRAHRFLTVSIRAPHRRGALTPQRDPIPSPVTAAPDRPTGKSSPTPGRDGAAGGPNGSPTPASQASTGSRESWSPLSWKTRLEAQRLRKELAEAEEGKRFVLQGGDCAETLDDCGPRGVTSRLKILLQMSLVLVHGSKAPVIRIGRMAGQYAKPRSSPTETRDIDGKPVTLDSYFGDLVNRAPFTPEARRPDPRLMLEAYTHAAMTLNFIRALTEGGFADLHHPEYWDLSWFERDGFSTELRAEYEKMTQNLGDGLRFMEALGERGIEDLTRVEFFTSHEGLNLLYESAQTRTVPRREGYYDLTTHLPWIGERTRDPGGAHVEFFRGIENPVGVKLGAKATAEEVRTLLEVLNPKDEPGKMVLITRLGAAAVKKVLPGLLKGAEGRRCLWMCDPMHGNTVVTKAGIKTRSFDTIREELETTFDEHRRLGSRLGGVHFELTGDNVTECVGGGAGVTEESLGTNYASPTDPRLNYQQSLEVAFLLARKLAG
jgi:3-deoxy-7-phosphoheptulonate synthase